MFVVPQVKMCFIIHKTFIHIVPNILPKMDKEYLEMVTNIIGGALTALLLFSIYVGIRNVMLGGTFI